MQGCVGRMHRNKIFQDASICIENMLRYWYNVGMGNWAQIAFSKE